MSAFGTAKVETNSLNLGFPVAYEDVYADVNAPQQYAPMRRRPEPVLPAGQDFQALWHEQKRKDAHYMANAKVQATNLANVRAFSSHAGYWNMPKPVLSQRRFANPSFGSGQADIYSARHTQLDGAGLVGGVLRTPAGQAYGINRLKARIAQLQAIANAKAGFDVGISEDVFAGAEPTFQDQLGDIPQIELALTLEQIATSILSGKISDITVKDSIRALSLIVRVATTGTKDEIINIINFISGSSADDGILPTLELMSKTLGEAGDIDNNIDEDIDEDYEDELTFMNLPESTTATSDFETASSKTKPIPKQKELGEEASQLKALLKFTEYWNKINLYLKAMLPLASRGVPYKDRQAKSKALLNTAKLTKPFFSSDLFEFQDLIQLAYNQNKFSNPLNRKFANEPTSAGATFTQQKPYEEIPANIDRKAGFGRMRGGRTRLDPINPLRREDSEHGYYGNGPARYTQNQRDVFAFESGQYQDNTGGRPRGFFGEQPAEYADAVSALNAVSNTALSEQGLPGKEQGVLASKVAPGGVPSMMSVQDSYGTYDIRVQQQKNQDEEKRAKALADAELSKPTTAKQTTLKLPAKAKQVQVAEDKLADVVIQDGACKPTYGGKKYTTKDIPKDADKLMAFIDKLHKSHKGYSQAIYKKGGINVANVRRNTIKKLKGAGLM